MPQQSQFCTEDLEDYWRAASLQFMLEAWRIWVLMSEEDGSDSCSSKVDACYTCRAWRQAGRQKQPCSCFATLWFLFVYVFETHFVDQIGLKLKSSIYLCLLNAGTNGVGHHAWSSLYLCYGKKLPPTWRDCLPPSVNPSVKTVVVLSKDLSFSWS